MAGATSPRLQLVGRPETAIISTSTALLPRQGGAVVSHDVNGYYAALGVRPTASRRELMAAYRDLDGQKSDYLTYAFKRLLDRRFREAYDARPPGRPVLDRYAEEEILRQAHRRAAQEQLSTGSPVTAADILFSLRPPSEEAGPRFLDSATPARFDDAGTGNRQSPPSSSPPAYSYLQYGSTCDDPHRMAQWQEGIARVLSSDGSVPQFAVGYHGIAGTAFFIMKMGGTPVIFLHEETEVTDELIAAAATAAKQ